MSDDKRGGVDINGERVNIDGNVVGRDYYQTIHYHYYAQARAENQTGNDPAWFEKAELNENMGEPETVLIPAGNYTIGRDPGPNIPANETPAFEVEMPAFRISKTPITNWHYYLYIHNQKLFPPPELGWNGAEPSDEQKLQPVLGITWYEAMVYCHWASERYNREFVLPTEVQWEIAMRNVRVEGIEIREWTSSLWGERRKIPNPYAKYPLSMDEDKVQKREKLGANNQIRRVIRGMTQLPPAWTATGRESQFPYFFSLPTYFCGFRVCLDSRR